MKRIRAFVAVELSDKCRANLYGYASSMLGKFDGIRLTVPENIHLTMMFLGHMEIETTSEVSRVLEDCAMSSGKFSMTVKGLGAFPNIRKPRTLWAGVNEETGKLAKLQDCIDKSLGSLGFKREKRAWVPHITLGRIKKPLKNENLTAALEKASEKMFAKESINSFTLMMSELSRFGPTYTKLGTFEVKN